MASIHTRKITSKQSLAPGNTYKHKWNNPPWGTVLGYFAYPVPPSASGPHGTSSGTVEVSRVSCTHFSATTTTVTSST